jgi:hypothetical protein
MTLVKEKTSTPNMRPANNELYPRRRVITGLTVSIIGLLIFLLGAKPAVYGLDRSPVIGYIQISVFLIGLAIICIGGYIALLALWKNRSHSILSDIGPRLVATGYVICVFSGMADMFGFGSHPSDQPYFGPLQAGGVILGQCLIGLGFLMMIPFAPPNSNG